MAVALNLTIVVFFLVEIRHVQSQSTVLCYNASANCGPAQNEGNESAFLAEYGASNKTKNMNESTLINHTETIISFEKRTKSRGGSNKTINMNSEKSTRPRGVSKANKKRKESRQSTKNSRSNSSTTDRSRAGSKAENIEIMAFVTAVTSQMSNGLESMLKDIRKHSKSITAVVFDFGLSGADKTSLNAKYSCIFRQPPDLPKNCHFPCKSQLIYSLLPQYDIIVWADIGHLPKWDLGLLLDDFPVGSAFIGHRSTSTLPKLVNAFAKNQSLPPAGSKASDSRLISTNFFALFVDFRLYNRVLLPWKSCSGDLRCPIAPRVAEYASTLPRQSVLGSWNDILLTHLLMSFEATYPRSVLLDKRPKRRASKPHASREPATIPRLGRGPLPDEPLLACLPLYGPNNQVVMLLHCAWLAARLGARLLVPPLRSHYLKTDRAHVSQSPALLPPDGVFSAHFLYRRAVLADANSTWDAALPALDLLVTNSDRRSAPPCAATAQCSVAALLRHRYLRALLRSVGAHTAPAAHVRVVACPSDREACARGSLAAGRVPLLLWNTIQLLRTRKADFSTLRAGPFRVPRAVLARGLSQPRACLAVHIRLKDEMLPGRRAAATAADASGAQLLRAPARDVLIRSDWGDMPLAGVVDLALRAARRRGLELYVLMPYHRGVFGELKRLGVRTVQDHDVAGLSELEVMQADMALGAGCEVLVRDEGSTLSDVMVSMAGSVGVMDPPRLLREEAAAAAAAAAAPSAAAARPAAATAVAVGSK